MSAKLQREVVITNDLGLHLRAAGHLAQRAAAFDANIVLHKGKLRANAKSIMSLLALTAAKGTTLLLEAEGSDARQAVDTLAGLIERGFVE